MRNVIHLGGRLLVICLVAGLMLGLVYNITLPYKQAAEAQALQEALENVCPGGAFEELDISAIPLEGVQKLYRFTGEAGKGHIAVVSSMGYKGEIPVTLAIADGGEITGISIGSHGETPGIGDRINQPSFWESFLGLTPPVAGTVQTITGATYSSRGVITAVDLAQQAIAWAKGA